METAFSTKKEEKKEKGKIEPTTQLHQAETSLEALEVRLVIGLIGIEALGH